MLTHTGCPECDKEKAKKAHKSGRYAKQKGNRYELQIINELKELGFEGVCSSRSQDKRADANKIDIVDMNGELPVNIQNKITQNTPNYFKIADDCTDKTKPFCIFWNRQEAVDGKVSMNSKGEVVFVPKDFFYKLLKLYKDQC